MSDRRLTPRMMSGFALGDHTINIGLSALSLLYLYFLSEVAGLRPALASLVLLVGRSVDAFIDPLIGRLSDVTRWRAGRRRPYFLIAALPFGASFALLWLVYPIDSPLLTFTIYSVLYVVHSVTGSMLAVPYMALLPELAVDYHARTRLNAYRQVGAVLGTLIAATAMRPLVDWFGGGAVGFAWTGVLLGIWSALPWLVVYLVTWERPEHSVPTVSFLTSFREVMAHGTYQRLLLLFLGSRMAMDLSGAMFVFYLTYWLQRPSDFPLVMGVMLITGTVTLPLWLRAAGRFDKAGVFCFALAIWIAALLVIQAVDPVWPRWSMLALAAVVGVGFAAGDLMPWAMLGDVIDEDELLRGARRDGMYAGVFIFLRKLAGAAAVAVGGQFLDVAGFVAGQPQSPTVLTTIRILTAAAPALLLTCAAIGSLRYPLGQARHREILQQLDERLAKAGKP